MKRVTGLLALAALVSAGCATAAVSGEHGMGVPVGPASATGQLGQVRAAPMVGPAIEAARGPAFVQAPRHTPTIATQRTIHGTPQAPVSPASPAAAEQPAPPSQPANAQCPANPGSGLPCVKR
jgi:hypothetical protein